jgi:hypothetical protein
MAVLVQCLSIGLTYWSIRNASRCRFLLAGDHAASSVTQAKAGAYDYNGSRSSPGTRETTTASFSHAV